VWGVVFRERARGPGGDPDARASRAPGRDRFNTPRARRPLSPALALASSSRTARAACAARLRRASPQQAICSSCLLCGL
jgi:hypothetical protein